MNWLFGNSAAVMAIVGASLGIATCISLLLVMGVSRRRTERHRQFEESRSTYFLSFGPSVKPAEVTAFIKSLAGLSAYNSMFGNLAVTFEVVSTPNKIEHYLRVPEQAREYVLAQLRSTIPSAQLSEAGNPPKCNITDAIEIGTTLEKLENRPAAQPMKKDERRLVFFH
jgi:hypothetical protein